MGASPDGLVDEVDGDSILEITCPSSIQEYTPREAFENGKLKFMTENNEGQLVLKEEDKRYYQVQGELNISEKTYCYFVVWTPKGNIFVSRSKRRQLKLRKESIDDKPKFDKQNNILKCIK